MSDKKNENRKNFATSYKGTFKEGSFEMDTSGEKPVAKAVMVLEGNSGVEKEIQGRGMNADKLKEAYEAGGTQILRGELYGGKDGYMSILAVGPSAVKGKLSHIRTNIDNVPEGKMPYFDAFLSDRGNGPKGGRIPGAVVKAFGDEALAFKGAKEGDEVSFDAMERREPRTGRDGEPLKDDDGKIVWQNVVRVEGNVTVQPAPEPEADEEAEPSM